MKDFMKLRIKSFKLLSYNVISITLTDDSVYTADLSSFNDIYCYPKEEKEWQEAFVGEFKADIQWPCGFDIHLHQIADLSMEQSA
jgi:hypothetical protein